MHTYLESLLQGAKIEWKALGEIAKLKNGKDWKKLSGGDIPVYGSGGEMGEFVAEYAYAKPTVLIPRKGSITNLFYLETPFWNVDTIYYTEINESLIVPKFFYYYLTTVDLENMATNATRPSLTQAIIDKIQIPLPPLAVQQKIVNILDKMTALTSALTSELSLRQKQYQYYRDKLLDFGEHAEHPFGAVEVEWKALGEVAEYAKTRIEYEQLNENNYVGVDNLLQNRAGKTTSNYVPTAGRLAKFTHNDILLGNIRPYLKKIWYADRVGGANADVLVIRTTEKALNPRYLFHVLSDDKFFAYNMQNAKGAKMPRGDKSAILQYPIALPPLAIQNKIVAILDKFDRLVHSISEGLPREIELRQKQYEYYRKLLLSFDPPN